MFGVREALIPAIKLVGLQGVEVVDGSQDVEYWHILFDHHEVIWANGAPSESLFTGPEALKAVSPEAREEITALFPEITEPGFEPAPARLIPQKGQEMKALVQRHGKNNKTLLDAL